MHSNRIKNIDFLTKYYNLEQIYLNNNEFEDIDSISNLTQLQVIFLNRGNIFSVKSPLKLPSSRTFPRNQKKVLNWDSAPRPRRDL